MYFNNFMAWGDARHLYPVICFFLSGYLSQLEGLKVQYKPLYLGGIALLATYGCLAVYHVLLQLVYDKPLPILVS
jgi:hypothetical protein